MRLLLQSGVALVFVTGLAWGGHPVTRLMAALSALIALPVWMLVLGGPRNLIELFLAAPIAGRAAQEMMQARGLTTLALFLGSGVDPAHARKIADGHVGRPLAEHVIQAALVRGGVRFGAGALKLQEDSEAPLLRAASRLVRNSQLRLRLLLLALAGIALVTLFIPAVRDTTEFYDANHGRPASLEK